MKYFEWPKSLRRFLACLYLLLAVGAPLLVLLMPGQPPLSVDESLLRVESGRFVSHAAALGVGADKYDVDVLNDLAGNVASTAADYPDGSNAVLALFENRVAATSAFEHLKTMIPHQQEASDLWATHFMSASGEYVMLAQLERVLVMVIAERETMARDRLAALPVLTYNARPGLGALLQQQSSFIFMLMMAFYVVVQWLLLRLLLSWAGWAVARPVENKARGPADE